MTPEELTAIRQRLGLGVRGLAAVLGVDPGAVSRWETGRRTIPPLLERALRDVERERREEQAG